MITNRQVTVSNAELAEQLGTVFAVFDERSQDSGHISYGVDTGTERLFVKTSGGPDRSAGGLTQDQRSAALRRTAHIHDRDHPALIKLHELVDTSDGVGLIHDWFDGSLLGCPRELRGDQRQPHNRFKVLPATAIATAIEQVIDLHVALEQDGWVLGDFYDGCLMYDFDSSDIRVMDFEFYHRGTFRNDRGRLPGSTRFMAPEEFRLGELIDRRTAVFNLGRMIDIFYLSEHPSPRVRALVDQSTADEPRERIQTIAELQRAWHAASAEVTTGRS